MNEKLNNSKPESKIINPEKFQNFSEKKDIYHDDSQNKIDKAEAKLDAFKKAEAVQRETDKKEPENNDQNRGFISKRQKETSYQKTILDLQTDMKPSERLFSKIIHNPKVEKASELTARTIARPNPLLYGSIFAFIITISTYLIAKKMGYRLSGSETILSFFIGWMVGLVYDYIRKALNINSDK